MPSTGFLETLPSENANRNGEQGDIDGISAQKIVKFYQNIKNPDGLPARMCVMHRSGEIVVRRGLREESKGDLPDIGWRLQLYLVIDALPAEDNPVSADPGGEDPADQRVSGKDTKDGTEDKQNE